VEKLDYVACLVQRLLLRIIFECILATVMAASEAWSGL